MKGLLFLFFVVAILGAAALLIYNWLGRYEMFNDNTYEENWTDEEQLP